MWLTGRLTPDFKTIANFRKDNGPAIRRVCRQFVMLCRQLDLFSEEVVAIDGSKFKAINNRDRNFTSAKMQRRMQQVEESIDRYLAAARHGGPAGTRGGTGQGGAAAGQDRDPQEPDAGVEGNRSRMLTTQDKQISLTDPDARSMIARDTGIVGYNVQTAVDAKHHLIVAHEVTNVGSDRGQLAIWPSKRASQWARKRSRQLQTAATSKAKRSWRAGSRHHRLRCQTADFK